MTKLSILELGGVREGSDRRTALSNALELAQHAEALGYHRFWVAEHHNMPTVTTAATSIVIAHIAGGTKTIRVGAGGIMLPNHAPLRHCRTIRNSGNPLPWSHRPWIGAGPRDRPNYAAGTSPFTWKFRKFSAGCSGIAGFFGSYPIRTTD